MSDEPRPRRILAVDDDATVLGLLRLLLEAAGYAVATAGSVDEAVAAVATAPPDLVICDVRLPGAPPFALRDHLAADPATAGLPVLLCSGALRELAAAAERPAHGRVATLPKPFDIDELVATVGRLLAPGAGGG